MDASLKRKIVIALEALIAAIDNGECDNMTAEQSTKLIECIELIVEIRQKPTKPIWKFWK